jgi:hypothetical protein
VTAVDAPVCGSEPPRTLTAPDGTEWTAGDCWCTLPPDHDGQCVCEPCRDRHGTPGWQNPDLDETRPCAP